MVYRDSYLWYLLSYFLGVLEVFLGRLSTMRPQHRDLSQKTAIVTGGNTGIGLETARKLVKMGATVVLACRSKEKGETARVDILQSTKANPSKVEVHILDCVDLQSVEKFAANWGKRPLDILINNAGGTFGIYSKTEQGFEMAYGVNMLSCYLLTLRLLPSMNKYARIINVSSMSSYDVIDKFNLNDLDCLKSGWFDGLQEGDVSSFDMSLNLYGRTKLMQVMFTKEMQERLDRSIEFGEKHITVHSCHPGMVRTGAWARPDSFQGPWKKYLVHFVNVAGISPEQGACPSVHLAVSDEAFQNKGGYWHRMSLRAPNRYVHDIAMRSQLWDKWAEQSGLGRPVL